MPIGRSSGSAARRRPALRRRIPAVRRSTARAWRRPLTAVLVLAAGLACKTGGKPATDAPSESPGGGGVDAGAASVQAMIDQGRVDEAAQRLAERPQDDAETLYLLGRLSAKKAQTAPLPTPPPAPSPLPRGAALPPAPEFKPEEIQAISYYEKAVAARPDYAAAHVALAELLAPHALRRVAVEKPAPEEATPRRRGGKRRTPAPGPLPDTGGVDVSVDRVIRAYQFALQADTTSATLPEALIGFGIQSGRVDAAEKGHLELLKRLREKPEPFIGY